MRWLLIIVAVLVVVGVAVGLQKLATRQQISLEDTSPIVSRTHSLANWPDRPYKIYLPSNYKSLGELPIIMVLHGGGSNSAEQEKLTCPAGDLKSPKCLTKLALNRNFVVAYINGTLTPGTKDVRTFNAGGGQKGFRCVSTYACNNGVDDVAYVEALINDMVAKYGVSRQKVFATGMSNGAAMSHRLACQLPGGLAAVATVGGENQFSTLQVCAPSKPVSVLMIHGTQDPAWPYAGGEAGLVGDKGLMKSAPDSAADWAKINGCGAVSQSAIQDDVPSDKTTVGKEVYGGCNNNASVVLYTVFGGGHTWPQGNQYLKEPLIGTTSQEISANEIILNFFRDAL